jgi:hypothetical protein
LLKNSESARSILGQFNRDRSVSARAKHSGPAKDLLDAMAGRQFKTILADPPWRFQNKTGKVAPEHRRLSRYATLTLDEICALPVAGLAAPTAHLYLWCPNALLPMGLPSWPHGALPTKPILYGTRSARMADRTGAASAFIFATSPK